jgi:hypothetical protein
MQKPQPMPAVALGWPKIKNTRAAMLPLFNTAHSCTKITSEGPTAPQTASSDFHARAKVFLPVAGWIPVKSVPRRSGVVGQRCLRVCIGSRLRCWAQPESGWSEANQSGTDCEAEAVDGPQPQRVVVNMDRTEIPVDGEREHSACDGHFESLPSPAGETCALKLVIAGGRTPEPAAIRGDAGLARAVAGSDGIERIDPGQVGSGTIPSELGSAGKTGRKWRN